MSLRFLFKVQAALASRMLLIRACSPDPDDSGGGEDSPENDLYMKLNANLPDLPINCTLGCD